MARSHRVPSVDHRLLDAEVAFATILLVTRALSQAQDLGLAVAVEQLAWSGIAQIAKDGYAAVEAAYKALPDLSAEAPDVEEGE